MESKLIEKTNYFSPFKQGVFTFILINIISLICFLFTKRNSTTIGIILSPIFLYCFFNPFLGVLSKELVKYIIQSVIMFFILGFYIINIGGFVAQTKFAEIIELQSMTALIFVLYLLVNFLGLVFRGLINGLEILDKY